MTHKHDQYNLLELKRSPNTRLDFFFVQLEAKKQKKEEGIITIGDAVTMCTISITRRMNGFLKLKDKSTYNWVSLSHQEAKKKRKELQWEMQEQC